MGTTTNGLTKSRTATAAILARRFVVDGAADGTGIQAAAATDKIIGVSGDIDTAIGERATVYMTGNIAPIVYGGTVARGDFLTSDATGRAIATTTIGNRYGGIAEVAGVVGDIGTCLVQPGIV